MQSWPASKERWVYLLAAALLAPGVAWVAMDHRVWPWDQAWYGEVSVDLWYWLTHSLLEWYRAMMWQMNLKPPGIVWIGQWFVPLRGILGSVENALLASVLLTEFLLLLFVYRIGRILSPSSPLAAAAGMVFAAGTQCFVGLSHQFFVEPLQGLAVAWIVWIASKAREWPNGRILLHLACALLLGALAKASTPIYCFVFCLYIAVAAIRWPLRIDFKAEWGRPASRCLMLAFAVVFPMTVRWYAANYKQVMEHIRISSSGDDALNYGFRAALGEKLIVWWRLTVQAFGAPYLQWAVLAAVLIGLAFYWKRRARTVSTAASIMVVSLIQILVVLYVFSLNDAVEPRYLYALVVNVAVVFMVLCSLIPSRAALAFLICLAGVQWIAVNAFALGIADTVPKPFWWLLKIHPDPTEYHLLDRAVQRTTIPNRNNITGIDVDWMNSNSAAFFAAKRRLDTGVRSYYTSLGYAESSEAAALRRIVEFNIGYLITLDEAFQPAPPNFLNLVALPVLRDVKHDPKFQPVDFPNSKGMLIFERR